MVGSLNKTPVAAGNSPITKPGTHQVSTCYYNANWYMISDIVVKWEGGGRREGGGDVRVELVGVTMHHLMS